MIPKQKESFKKKRIHRHISRKMLRYLKLGKQVSLMIEGVTVCLSLKDANAQINKKIAKHKEKIRQLEESKKG